MTRPERTQWGWLTYAFFDMGGGRYSLGLFVKRVLYFTAFTLFCFALGGLCALLKL